MLHQAHNAPILFVLSCIEHSGPKKYVVNFFGVVVEKAPFYPSNISYGVMQGAWSGQSRCQVGPAKDLKEIIFVFPITTSEDLHVWLHLEKTFVFK